MSHDSSQHPAVVETRIRTALTSIVCRAQPHAWAIIACVLFAGFLILRLPFRAEYLISWDAANYALGTELFDLEYHQPHPPGYIGYIALGWLLNHLTGNANTSFTMLSAVSGAAAPAAVFLLGSYFTSRKYATITAVLFGLSPVVWYYSEVALGYALEMALAAFILWLGYHARTYLSFRHLLIATVLLVVLGAVRQSGALFLFPLWFFIVWPFPWRHRLKALGVLVAGNLLWLIPLLWLAGGPVAYIQASRALAGLAVSPTTILSLNPLGWAQNVGYVAAALVVGVNAGLIAIALAYALRTRPLAGLSSDDRIFFVLWLAPALATYLLLHTGQMGYMLLILPAAFLWLGLSLSSVEHHVRTAWSISLARGQVLVRTLKGRSLKLRHGFVLATSLAVACALASSLVFLHLPETIYAVSRPDSTSAAQRAINDLFDSLPLYRLVSAEESDALAQRALQFNVERSDEHWEQLIRLVKTFDPDTTAILTVPDGSGSFRHLTHYLPQYRIYGMAKDLDDNFGHLCTAHEGISDYNPEKLEEASRHLDLPEGVTLLLVPDKGLANRFVGNTDTIQLELQNGTKVLTIETPDDALLHVVENSNGNARILVDENRQGHTNEEP